LKIHTCQLKYESFSLSTKLALKVTHSDITLYFFLKIFIYLERERERAQAGGTAEGEGEAGSPRSREPDAGLDPRTPGS